MKGSLIENLAEFVKDLKMEAVDLINQARASLTMGNEQAAKSYLRYSGIFNVAANNLRGIYLNLMVYDLIVR